MAAKSTSSKGAGAQKIKAGPTGKMNRGKAVQTQVPGQSATSQKNSSKSYAKGG